ncbi:MAG: hypothetical protein OEM81_05550 [Acidimicrobiia bacterium]|nr:hypothetical protein [Acidimicrobiia bacterium]MDH3397282.1 hypothetical protein [Acidimicrobiia bacterium]
MNRLAELDEKQRTRLGAAALLIGTLMLAVGVIIAHYAAFPATELIDGVDVPVQVDYLGWIPRGWPWVTLGQIIAFGGSQLMVIGALFLWFMGRKLTWARATFGAFIAWIQLVLYFGVVPSEWLNLTQGPLEFTSQRVAFTIPKWLVLGNQVDVSLSAVKDAVSGGYNTIMLGAAIVFAYKIQDWGKSKPDAAEQKQSVYGRPLVKGD